MMQRAAVARRVSISLTAEEIIYHSGLPEMGSVAIEIGAQEAHEPAQRVSNIDMALEEILRLRASVGKQDVEEVFEATDWQSTDMTRKLSLGDHLMQFKLLKQNDGNTL